ncbi:MAG: polysaccharide deacetylase family protein [Firmicutes bacterium]|nr:polysaccharide deacetylase family protein [Bacillota bacterium]
MKKPLFFLIFCVLLVTIVTVSAISVSKSSCRPEPVFQAEGTDMSVFFTFNVLWGESQLEALLQLLDEYEIKAVFFISGQWLKKYPQTAKKIVDRGHWIGNHTYTHSKLPFMGEEAVAGEINRFNSLCRETLFAKPVFFRPPYGEYNAKIVRIASENSCYTLLWSINALTLSNLEMELVISHIEERIHAGAVILFHSTTPAVLETLPPIIEFLRWKGYTIASPDLILEYAEKKFPLPGR